MQTDAATVTATGKEKQKSYRQLSRLSMWVRLTQIDAQDVYVHHHFLSILIKIDINSGARYSRLCWAPWKDGCSNQVHAKPSY